jgi:hypothetical protein
LCLSFREFILYLSSKFSLFRIFEADKNIDLFLLYQFLIKFTQFWNQYFEGIFKAKS